MARSGYRTSQPTQPRIWPMAWLGAVFGFTLGAVAYAPASWLATGLESGSGGYVRLLNPTGTIWQGSAALVLASGQTGADKLALPSRLRWKLRLATSGGPVGLDVILQADCCIQTPLTLRLAPSGLHIASGTIQLPLSVLQGLGTPWNTLGLRGSLMLRWVNFVLPWQQGIQHLDGAMEIQASHVATRLTTLPDIGSYQLRLATSDSTRPNTVPVEPSGPQLVLSTLRGDLLLNGRGHWQDGKFRFEGEAQSTPERAAALTHLLTLLGDKRNGITKIRWGQNTK